MGADESHAWVSVYAGEKLGWVDLDPTNACLSDTNHIPICVGRDYSEVSPMRGVVLGGGTTNLRVSVDVDAACAAADARNGMYFDATPAYCAACAEGTRACAELRATYKTIVVSRPPSVIVSGASSWGRDINQ